MRALIFSAGHLGGHDRIRSLVVPRPGDLVICADGGTAHALALGLRPNLVVGDLDSLPAGLAERLASDGVPVERAPRDKDQTDTHLALAAALARGATEVVLLGAVGTRLDHTLGNLLLLPGLPAGVTATLVDGHNVVRLLGPGAELSLSGRPGDTVSLLPLTPRVTGICTRGLRWELTGATLAWGQSRGISNELTGGQAGVQVGQGWLLVVESRD